jgi:hypothetical protein
MISERKIAANRRNACKSTGPRSHAGKNRTRGNAARHGLAARILFDPQFVGRIQALAAQLAAASDGLLTFDSACAFAQAELDLERIRRLKVVAIEEALAERRMTFLATVYGKDPVACQNDLAAVTAVLAKLVKMDRYERRAASRRDHALRDLMAGLSAQGR